MPLFSPSIYRFTQATPSATWNINHALGSNGSQGIPIVDVFITEGGVDTKIMPGSVIIADANNVQLIFSEPRSGFAVIIV